MIAAIVARPASMLRIVTAHGTKSAPMPDIAIAISPRSFSKLMARHTNSTLMAIMRGHMKMTRQK